MERGSRELQWELGQRVPQFDGRRCVRGGDFRPRYGPTNMFCR